VRERTPPRRGRFAPHAASAALTVVLALAAMSCGDDGEQADSEPGASEEPASGAANGEQLARSSGCAGCHGADFGGGAGPGWVGLAGSDVELVDGTVVVADTAYLTRAIADPSAEVAAGYTLRMPANNLSDAEIADIVAFIETLADE